MDPKKIKAIVNQQDLKNITGLKSFLRFYNYYKQFINSRFNLLSDLVPLVSLYRQIPIEKTSLFIEKKPIFR